MSRSFWIFTIVALTVSVMKAAEKPRPSSPVLVELFTSEGCSSCPPADALLRQLDAQPIEGAQVIVLSEHVDYWNHLGWSDPYSSSFFSQRQSAYARQLGNSDVYTPQMIVDGARELVGSDSRQAEQAIKRALGQEKLQISLSEVAFNTPGVLRGRIGVASLPASMHLATADIYLAVALSHAESQVLRGENGGRRLQHVAVVRTAAKVGSVTTRSGFEQEASVKVERDAAPSNLRVIVFAQDPKTGRVLGAAMQLLKP
jgi:hypothetical protein